MKKILFTCAALAMMIAFAPAANAQLCLDFDAFCDGLELSASGGVVSGDWVSYDCAGARATMGGNLSGGTARVLCQTCDNCAVSPGINWGFILDGLDGTMDMYQDAVGGCSGPNFTLWIDELAYTNTGAPCTFLADSPFGASAGR